MSVLVISYKGSSSAEHLLHKQLQSYLSLIATFILGLRQTCNKIPLERAVRIDNRAWLQSNDPKSTLPASFRLLFLHRTVDLLCVHKRSLLCLKYMIVPPQLAQSESEILRPNPGTAFVVQVNPGGAMACIRPSPKVFETEGRSGRTHRAMSLRMASSKLL